MFRDRHAIGAIILIYLAWGALLFAQDGRYCASDCVVEMLPRLMAVARAFQSFTLALWDVNTFAGAKPLWETQGGTYYPLFYPLYLLTDSGDPRQAALLLLLFPFVLHHAWAASGAYFFGRRILHLTPLGAMVVGLVYSFSPAMLEISLVYQARGYSFLPWVTLTALRLLETGSRRTWAAGALLVSAMCFATNPDLVNRMLFLVGIQVAAYWLVTRRDLPRQGLSRLVGLLAMVLVGLATYSFHFAGLFQGILMGLRGLAIPCDQVAAYGPYSSARPTALLGLFYPASFLRMEALASSGGVLLLGAVTYALATLPATEPDRRRRTLIAAGVAIFGMLVSLGHYTPVFGWLCAALPPFFGFPHPARYALAITWGLALLAGTGVSRLTTSPPSRRLLFVCSWPLIVAALLLSFRQQIPSFDWGHTYPSATGYVIASALVLLTAAVVPLRLRAVTLCAGILLETLATPLSFARDLPRPEAMQWADYPTWTLARTPTAEVLPALRRISEADSFRFVGTESFVDNQAWVTDGRALFGMQASPLFPRFERAFLTFTHNAPNDVWLTGLPWLLPNMNVGYIIADRGPEYRQMIARECPQLDRAIGSLPLIEQTESFDVRQVPSPLPYVYTQDRVFVTEPDDQLLRLLATDLRNAAYVSAEAAADPRATVSLERAASDLGQVSLPCKIDELSTENLNSQFSIFKSDFHCCQTDDRAAFALPSRQGAGDDRFADLQAANPVTVDRRNPNRKWIRAEVSKPSLLVVNENWERGWHARVDGKDVPLWQVNYIHQGIWLQSGTHNVELSFYPRELTYGAIASASALLIIGVVAISAALTGSGKIALASGQETR